MARVDDFITMIFNLLPLGALLDRARDSEFANLFFPFARELERLEQQGEFIARDFDPRTTTLFLEDYERLLALPECGGPLGSTQERRDAVFTKLTAERNLSPNYIEQACIDAGFDVEILLSGSVDHQFEVDLPAFGIAEFRTGTSVTGDRLGAWSGVDELICLLDRIKPHWTTYILTSP